MVIKNNIYLLLNMKIFITTALLVLLHFIPSCGLPNPLSLEDNNNPPYLVATISSNSTIFMRIHSFNTENNAPNFTGYNIYFDNISNISQITSKLIVLANLTNGPTVRAQPIDNVQFTDVRFENITWVNLSESNRQRQTRRIEIFDTYYFIVTSKNETQVDNSVANSHYVGVFKENIEYNEFNTTTTMGGSKTFSNAQFTFVNGYISVNGATWIQDVGYHPNWFDVTQAPAAGYSQASVPILINHIYAYTTGSNFGKIMVLSTNNSTITYNFSYQGLPGDLEI